MGPVPGGPSLLLDPRIPSLLFPPTVGPVSVSFSPVPSLAEIVERNPRVEAGGRYRPAGCEPRSRTAIIVPHRAREHHLRLLLYHLHPFLQRQQLAYGIYVIHQVPQLPRSDFLVRKPQVNAAPLSYVVTGIILRGSDC